jgi:hypothetical protein
MMVLVFKQPLTAAEEPRERELVVVVFVPIVPGDREPDQDSDDHGGPASAEPPLKLGLAICLLLHKRLGFLSRKRLRPPFFFPRVLYAAG